MVNNFSGFYGFSCWYFSAWLFCGAWYAPALELFFCLAGFRLDHDTADCIFEQGILYTKSALGDAGQCFSNNDVPQKSLCA